MSAKHTTTAAALLWPAAYLLLFRRRWLNWGARPDEVTASLPGDELLPAASLVTTRAISVKAPPEAIWPWLVQMGSGRGGAYSYDWIENLLGLNMHSASEILTQFQDLRQGDKLPLGPRGPVLTVAVLDPGRTLAVTSADGRWAWIFALRPEEGGTRLISRNRIDLGMPLLARLPYLLVMEPGSLVMERKMLRGIRQRAQSRTTSRPVIRDLVP